MKALLIILTFVLSTGKGNAQYRNKEALCPQSMIETQLRELESSFTDNSKLWTSYYIIDLGAYKMFDQKATYGVYVFGMWGDDLPYYFLIHDEDNCSLLPAAVTYDSMRQLLDFLKTHNYSAEEKLCYIENYMSHSEIDFQYQAFKHNEKLRELFKDTYKFEF